MAAALDRCRSYRRDKTLKCRFLAIEDTLTDTPSGVTPHWVSRIQFSGNGFSGSPEAGMSYLPDDTSGYIWLVDPERNRDCKGEWHTRDDGATWSMLCKDGLTAEGDMTLPSTGMGVGWGEDMNGEAVNFTFAPDPAE